MRGLVTERVFTGVPLGALTCVLTNLASVLSREEIEAFMSDCSPEMV